MSSPARVGLGHRAGHDLRHRGQMTRESRCSTPPGSATRVSLVFLSVREARERLEALPLVKTAAVRKLYPDELVVTLVEREPYALWQMNGELFVIAADGTVIDTHATTPRFAYLPLVVGEQANLAHQGLPRPDRGGRAAEEPHPRRDARLRAPLDAQDRQRPGRAPARASARSDALACASSSSSASSASSRRTCSPIDLRMPDRVVVRLTEEAAAARAESLKKKPMRGKGVET